MRYVFDFLTNLTKDVNPTLMNSNHGFRSKTACGAKADKAGGISE
jgi:hypothetical protein